MPHDMLDVLGMRLRNIFHIPQGSSDIMMDDPRKGGITGMSPMPVSGETGSDFIPSDISDSERTSDFIDDSSPTVSNRPSMGRHTAEDAFMKSINDIPQRNKPSIWRKIGAGLVSVGDRGQGNDAEKFLYSPYYRKLADWKIKNEALHQGASIERMNNSADSLNQYRDESINAREAELARKTREGEARIGIAETSAQTAAKNAETAKKKAEFYTKWANGAKPQVDENGTPYLIEINADGSTTRHNIDADVFTDKEKQDIAIKARKEMADKATKDRADLEAQRNRDKLEQIGASGSEARKTRATAPGSNKTSVNDKPVGSGTPYQETAAKKLRITQAQNDYPQYAKVIDKNGVVAPSSKSWGGLGGYNITPEDRKILTDFIEHGIKPPEGFGGSTTSSKPTNTTSTQPGRPAPIHREKITKGTPPPIEQREIGDLHTFDNGKQAIWKNGPKGLGYYQIGGK